MSYGGFGFAIFLVALGAILRYAVTAEVAGVDIGTIGVILMIAGIALFLLTLAFTLFGRRPDQAAASARLLSLEARRSGQSNASPWTVTAQRTRPFATIARIDQAG